MQVSVRILNVFRLWMASSDMGREGSAITHFCSLLSFAALMAANTDALAAFDDCRDWSKKRYKDFNHCRAALDKKNHQTAVLETATRPRTVIRNRPSNANAQLEHSGKTRGFSHFTAKPSESGRAATKENSMGTATGYYSHRLKTGDSYLKAKQAGAHGNKREILVPRKDVRKDKNSSFTRYQK